MKPGTLVIVNPTAGKGRGRKAGEWIRSGHPAILRFAHQAGLGDAKDWAFVLTDAEGAWKSVVRDRVRAGIVDHAIIAGGDGTLMEAAEIFGGEDSGGKKISILPIPAGRGNDFVRGLHSGPGKVFDSNPEKYWAAMTDGSWSLQKLDLVQSDRRIFLNMCSVAYGGYVVQEVHRPGALFGSSPLVYQVQGALVFFKKRNVGCQIVADGKRVYSGPAFAAAVSNGKANGGGLYWAPAASSSDGLLDILVFPKPSLVGMVGALGDLRQAKELKISHRKFQAREVKFHFDRAVPIEMDGEYGDEALSHGFTCLPARLNLWVLKL